MSEQIPAAFYSAVAIKFDTDNGPTYAQFGESKNGTKQILMQFKILDGDYAGRVVPWFGYFTTKTVDTTLKAMRNCGMKGEDLFSLWGANAQELNQVVQIETELNENPENGKVHARVRWVNSVGGGGVKLKKPMTEADMRKFAAQMKGHLKKVAEVEGETADAADIPGEPAEDRGDDPALDSQRRSVPPAQEDDLPF